MQPLISIIYPVYNESQTDFLDKNILAFLKLQKEPHFEIIFIDGGSEDDTEAKIKKSGLYFEVLEDSTRIGRLIRGYQVAKGELIVFHHPRSFIEEKGWPELKKIATTKDPQWGGFTHQFDREHPLLKFTSWYSNQVRFDVRNIIYLDHCIFFHRDLIDAEDIEDVPIFEDTLLSQKLNQRRPPIRLGSLATTSAIRFEKNGVWAQAMKNQRAKLQFYLKRNYNQMNEAYEEGLNLNQEKES